MKKIHCLVSMLAISVAPQLLSAEDVEDARSMIARHSRGSEKLADEQDELSADVQQLVIEQTNPKVIQLLSEVEGIMDETTDYLADQDTGGKTIAAQTEIIEKIHEAAKEKQAKGGGAPGSAMMDMMERMLGKKEGEGEGKGKGKGKGAGSEGGEGKTGDSDSANSANSGNAGGNVNERTVPKSAGQAGKGLPGEFQQALDAYNRGLEGKTK